MIMQGDWEFLGKECASVARVRYEFEGQFSIDGPIEIAWADGTATVFDVRSDWTLCVRSERWVDPLGDATESERRALAREVGLWFRFGAAGNDPLADLLSRRVSNVEPLLNDIGELAGLEIDFDGTTLTLRQFGGDLTSQVASARSPRRPR